MGSLFILYYRETFNLSNVPWTLGVRCYVVMAQQVVHAFVCDIEVC